MADAKIRLSVEGGSMVKSELDKVNAGLNNLSREADFVKNSLLALTGGLSVGFFIGMIRGSIDAADHLNDLSKSTGLAVEQLAGLKLAAKQSGGDLDSIAASINKLSVNIGKDGEKFKALGVNAKDPLEAMKQLADIFVLVKDPQLRAALGAEALGKSWAGAAPFLMEGSKGIQEMVDKGAKLSGMTGDMASNADTLNDKWLELGGTGGFLNRQVAPLLPILIAVTNGMLDTQEKSSGANSQLSLLAETMRGIVLLGGSVAHAFRVGGIAIGGFAAQMASLNLGGGGTSTEIGRMWKQDVAAANADFKDWGTKIQKAEKLAAEEAAIRKKAAEDKKNDPTAAAAQAAADKKAKDFLSSGKGGADKVTEYARITQEITKTNAVSAQELLYGSKLAASDKYRVETMAKVEAAYVNNKISLLEKAKLTEMVTAASAQMYLVEKQAFEVDAIKKNTEAVDKLNEATLKTIESLVSSNEQKRLENEVIGLTAEAVNRLTLERLDANIAEEQSRLIGLKNADADAVEIAQMERKINLLQQQRNLTDAGQTKTAYSTLKTDVLGEAKPAASSYDPRELAGIIGAETEKVAAYNATARVVLANAEAKLVIDKAQIASSRDLTAAEAERFTSLQAEIDKIRGNLELNFKVAGLDDISTKLGSMSATAGKLGDGFKGATAALSGFSSGFKTLAAAQKNTTEGSKERIQQNIDGYGQMAGAAKEMFDKNSAGYEVLGAVEKAFYAAKMAMSVAAIAQNWVATGETVAQDAITIPADTAAGVAKTFAQSGWGGFVGAVAILAFMASLGYSSGGGGGSAGGGGAGSASANGVYTGTGQAVSEHGQIYSQRGAISGGDSSAAQAQQDQDQAALDSAEAMNKLNLSLRKLQDGASALEQDLIDVKLATQGAGNAQYELATKGLDGAELAAYNYNAALRGQIAVLLDVANGTENATRNMKKLVDETVSLQIDIMRASGDLAGANAAQFGIDTAGYTADEIAVYKYNQGLKEQKEAMQSGGSAASDAAAAEEELASKRRDLQNQIDVLNGTSTQTQIDRAMQLAGTSDEASIALMGVLFGLQDLAAQKEIQNSIDILSGKTTQTKIDREKALISTSDESAKSLLNMLYGMQDLAEANAIAAAAAAKATAAAAEAAAKAAEIAKALAAELAPAYQKFRPDAAFKYKSIAGELGAAGVGTGDVASWMGKSTKDQILEAASAIYNMAETTDTMRRAIVKAASALADMKDEADAAALAFASQKEDAAFAALTRSVDAQRKAATAANEVAQESVANLKSIFDMLDSNIKDLYGTVDATREQTMVQGAAFIDNALSTALATGYMPLANELSDALSSVRGGMGEKVYGSEIERKRDALVLAGKLSQLKDIAGPQLTTAELTLKAAEDQNKYLDSILEEAKAQIDVLRGIDTSVLSVADALLAFASQLAGSGTIRAGVSSTKPGDITNAEIAAHLAPRLGVSEEQNRNIYNDAFANRSRGVTLDKINVAGNLAPGTAEAWAIANGLPLFANGGDHSGGWAMVGERGPELAYMPPARIYNAGDTTRMMSGGDNSELIAELRLSNERLEARLQAIEKNTSRTAEAVNGNSARPMLVEAVV